MRITSMILAYFTLSLSLGAAAKSADIGWIKLLQQAGQQDMSVQFVKVEGQTVLLKADPAKLLVPASTMKVITTAAALDTLSPKFQFKTRFYHTGKRSGGVIKGDLIVVGDGDPYIVSEQMWQLAADFEHLGIKRIEGDIVIDNGLFGGEARDRSRADGALSSSNAYDAPVSAFGVNFNTVAVAVAPDAPGTPALSSLDPYPLRNVNVVNLAKTASSTATRLQAQRLTKKDGTELRVSGAIGSRTDLTKIYRSVGSPVTTSGEYLRAFLQGRGIDVTGKTKSGGVPTSAILLYTLESYPLSKIVTGLNKYSNNYIADVLTKRLGAERPQQGSPRGPGSGTYANGLQVMNQFLNEKVATAPGFRIINGSGLSTANLLSAENLTDVLLYAAKHLEIFPEFLASFPASGWDGTLENRFDQPGQSLLSGKVRAKTGTLTQPVSVSALAGYVRHPMHGLVAFAIIQNGVKGKPQPSVDSLRRSQDALLAGFVNSK